jgi:hypothetical protein
LHEREGGFPTKAGNILLRLFGARDGEVASDKRDDLYGNKTPKIMIQFCILTVIAFFTLFFSMAARLNANRPVTTHSVA